MRNARTLGSLLAYRRNASTASRDRIGGIAADANGRMVRVAGRCRSAAG